MKKIQLVARILLGISFVVFGLNGFLNFMPPPPMEGTALEFMTGLFKSGYFFPLLKSVEIICGVLLLVGYAVPLALIILFFINVNILAFHLVLFPPNIALVIFLIVLNIFLIVSNWSTYKVLLVKKTDFKLPD